MTCTSVKDLAASVLCLESQVGAAAAKVSALTEELRGLDTKISAAFAEEIVELSQDAAAKHSQLESLLGLSEERLKAQLLAFKQQLDVLPFVDVEASFKQCADAVSNHFGSLLTGLQERINLDVMVIRGRLAALEQGTRTTTAGASEPLCSQTPCDGGSQSLATSLSACDDDATAFGDDSCGVGLHGGGGGGGVVGGTSCAASSPQSAADVEAAIARLSFEEIARRFQLLPEALRGGGAILLSISRSLLALQPL